MERGTWIVIKNTNKIYKDKMFLYISIKTYLIYTYITSKQIKTNT
jgi:hypothetical protein